MDDRHLNRRLNHEKKPRISPRTKRLPAAIAIRDAVVEALNRGDIFERLPAPIPNWEGGGFTVSYREPMENGGVVMTTVEDPFAPYILCGMRPYGFDIWLTGLHKVMNLEWQNQETTPVIVSFRRGPWEGWLLDFIRAASTPATTAQ